MKPEQKFSLQFYIRQNKNKRKNYSIYCCIKVGDTTPKEVSIYNAINREDWNERKGYPKQNSDVLLRLCSYLDSIKNKLLNIYLELKLREESITASRIKDIYQGVDSLDCTILKLIDTAIFKYQKELSSGSLKNYGATRAYVAAFVSEKYKRDLPLKFVTYSFIEDLKTYILNNPIKQSDPCTNNGCMKHLERLKKIITWAHEMRFIDRNVFASFKIRKRVKDVKKLSWHQLRSIEQKEFSEPALNLVRDLFIFCCYTGMAPADLEALKAHQINEDANGITWLSYSRRKSAISANVPLLKPALSLIEKYQPSKSFGVARIFPAISNQYLNKNLKIIGETCEIGFPLNFYISRHTFATTITLQNGVPITSIKDMMGHKRIENTMHYAKSNNSIVANDMMKIQAKFFVNIQ